MSYIIEVVAGSSIRLPVGGKYCDRDIIVKALDKKEFLNIFYEGRKLEKLLRVKSSEDRLPYISPDETCVELILEDGIEFVRLSDPTPTEENEIYVKLPVDGNAVTGQYCVIKYRCVSSPYSKIDLYANTTGDTESSLIGTHVIRASEPQTNDWHVVVFNAADGLPKVFQPSEDGKYRATLCRFDVYNREGDGTTPVIRDIAYIGMCDILEKALAFDPTIEDVIYADSSGSRTLPRSYMEAREEAYEVGISMGIEAKKEKLLTSYFDYKQLYQATTPAPPNRYSLVELYSEYVRYTPYSSTSEAFCYVFENTEVVCGRYIIVKYRLPSASNCGSFEVFADTESTSAASGQNMVCNTIKKDGKWHIAVFDAKSYRPNEYTPNVDGTYTFKYLRIDTFNCIYSSFPNEEDYTDIAYIGTATSLEKIFACNKDIETITLVEGEGAETEKENPYAK